MNDSHKTQLLTGLALVIVASFCALSIFYLIVTTRKEEGRKIEEMDEQVKQLTLMRDQMKDELDLIKKAPPQPLSLQDLLKRSQEVYGQDEKSRKAGFLWVDRQTATYIITLGALNGLNPGSRLNVYQGEMKIGQVVVDTPMDVISYVHPVSKTEDNLKQDYYQVVME